MSDVLDPPSPLAARLFEAERERPDVSAAVLERMIARLAATIGGGLGDLASDPPKEAPPADPSPAGGPAPAGDLSVSAGAATNAGVASGLTAKVAPWIALAFATGAGVGAGVQSAVTPRIEVPVVVSVSVPVASVASRPLEGSPLEHAVPTTLPIASRSSAPPAPVPLARGGPTVVLGGTFDAGPSATAAPRASSSGGPRGADLDLAAERALIDRATMALARGQHASALDTLDEHASRFPRGRLAEEREALAIRALARAGRSEEARERAQTFRRTFPTSLLMPAVDAVVPRSR